MIVAGTLFMVLTVAESITVALPSVSRAASPGEAAHSPRSAEAADAARRSPGEAAGKLPGAGVRKAAPARLCVGGRGNVIAGGAIKRAGNDIEVLELLRRVRESRQNVVI